MKVEVKTSQNKKEIKLPYLITMKEAEGKDIILVYSEDKGCYQGLVLKHRNLEVGEITSSAIKSLWKPFEGEVTLSNNF